MTEQEQQWVARARNGDGGAFSCLVEAYQRPVYNLAYRMLGSAVEAEDAAQETFLRAYARLEQYDPQRKFSTWLFSIANNYCIDLLRRRRHIWLSMDDNPVLQNLAGDAVQPEQSLLQYEQADEVQHLVQQLEPEYRTPVVLRYWQDYSYQEIADTMDISLSAVKSRLFRARQRLAELYEEGKIVRVAAMGIPSAEAAPGPARCVNLEPAPVW